MTAVAVVMTTRRSAISLCFLLACACGGAPPAQTPAIQAATPPPTPAPAPAPASEPAPEPTLHDTPTTLSIPTECASEPCVPPPELVQELCKRNDPDLAFVFFRDSTPWRRAYARVSSEAWYAGARLASPKRLKVGEEMIVLAERRGSGIVVGGGSFDALRWDGTCVSLMADELSLERPRGIEVAPIVWRRLNQGTRDRLEQVADVERGVATVRKRCRQDPTTSACEMATDDLSRLIADYVRAGGDIPEPKLVMW